jgi:hypothetical protein
MIPWALYTCSITHAQAGTSDPMEGHVYVVVRALQSPESRESLQAAISTDSESMLHGGSMEEVKT